MALRPSSSWSGSDRLRWAIWSIALLVWTLALTTPHGAQAGRAVVPVEAAYSSSKGLHIVVYALLALTATGLPARRAIRPWLLGLLVVHGPVTEFIQIFVPLRTGTLTDVAYDEIGIGLGLLLRWRWWLTSDASEPPVILKHPANDATPANWQRSA